MGGSTEGTKSQPGSTLRVLIAGLLVLTGVGILAAAMSSSNAANKDFVTYWAAGRQLLHHANPYDGSEVLRLEREAGSSVDRPYFMRNPPIALFLTLPFGAMNEWLGALTWSLLLVLSLMASIRMVWKLMGEPPGRLHLAGYMFPPALECLTVGQVGVYLLLGFTSFLYFRRTKPFFAGASLVLCLLKPHMFLPLSVVLLLWFIHQRTYKVLAGLTTAVLMCVLITAAIDPSAWRQYAQMMRSVDVLNEPLPTISLLFRVAIEVRWTWLQFVPAAIASVWAIWYFRRQQSWSWVNQGLLLLTVSVMVAPYGFVTDEALLLPAILFGLYSLEKKQRSLAPYLIVVLPALAEVLAGVGVNSFWHVWTAPAWFGFYLYATRSDRELRERDHVRA